MTSPQTIHTFVNEAINKVILNIGSRGINPTIVPCASGTFNNIGITCPNETTFSGIYGNTTTSGYYATYSATILNFVNCFNFAFNESSISLPTSNETTSYSIPLVAVYNSEIHVNGSVSGNTEVYSPAYTIPAVPSYVITPAVPSYVVTPAYNVPEQCSPSTTVAMPPTCGGKCSSGLQCGCYHTCGCPDETITGQCIQGYTVAAVMSVPIPAVMSVPIPAIDVPSDYTSDLLIPFTTTSFSSTLDGVTLDVTINFTVSSINNTTNNVTQITTTTLAQPIFFYDISFSDLKIKITDLTLIVSAFPTISVSPNSSNTDKIINLLTPILLDLINGYFKNVTYELV